MKEELQLGLNFSILIEGTLFNIFPWNLRVESTRTRSKGLYLKDRAQPFN